jgi:hypothetical protein
VESHRFACPDCWDALPVRLRAAITSSYGRDADEHWDAMAAAYEWFLSSTYELSPGAFMVVTEDDPGEIRDQ